MELKGTIELEESFYKKSLELAFLDYLDEDVRTPELFKNRITERLLEDFESDITLDEETVAQAVEDTKKLITEILKSV